ncbi:MAG TPA: AmmeMemoRadiSam system protein B [Bacteroidota bacterium]|nr:AmmeMemoRadiSam system protein B [Bacteroidota bacterium]
MIRTRLLLSGVLLTAVILHCSAQQATGDRPAAVAGQFYPADRKELADMLEQLYAAAAPDRKLGDVAAIICPHAGYIYCGDVIASSFNQVDMSKEYDNIFVIGTSHYTAFEGASVYDRGNFITPLGPVEVNTDLAKQLIASHPVFSNRNDAQVREHCLEVELPFLQSRMKHRFRIVPIVIGAQTLGTIREIAGALRPYLTPRNLFVISSDFSHYPAYADAETVDRATGRAIVRNSTDTLLAVMERNGARGIPNLATSLCGWSSVLTLLSMTESDSAFSYIPIRYSNSGDAPAGDKSRVVGYHSFVVIRKESGGDDFRLGENDKEMLMSIARHSVEQVVRTGELPRLDTIRASRALGRACGVFVTLREDGRLRGCIGRFEAEDPLYLTVREMAAAAALRDPRFKAVAVEELPRLSYEVSVLTPLKRIHSIEEFRLGTDGIYMRKGEHTGTFLPEVAKETGWSKEEFLGHCAQEKAGIGWDGWKDAELYTYQALVIGGD